MKILLVEDDEHKKEIIKEYLISSINPLILTEKSSYHSALEAVINNEFDLIILDMSMPISDFSDDNYDYEPDTFAGRELLDQMQIRKINVPVIIVTQFDIFDVGNSNMTLKQLELELLGTFKNFKKAIFYRSDIETWKKEISNSINIIFKV